MALKEAQEKQKKKHIEYWSKREEEAVKRRIVEEKAYERELKRIYQDMLDNVQKEIDAFYGKYAKNNNITLAEAKKAVSKLDIKAYERKAKRYVKDRDFSKEANEEMRLYNLTMKVNRLEMLKANIGLELISGHDELQKYMEDILQGRTMDELERQAGILGKTIRNNAQTANAIVNASFHNAKFSDRIWMHQDLLKNELNKLLQTGLIAGRNPRVLARELENKFGSKRTDAERLMRTELARVQTEAQRQSFEANGFTQYIFLALGDACDICKDIDENHYDVADMTPGLNAPPMHPHCRCSTAAYEDDDEYNAWIDYLEKGGTTEEWNKLPKDKKRFIMEPEDKGDLNTDLGALSDNTAEASLQINNYLNTLGLPESKWSGQTKVKTAQEMLAPGKKKSNCDIWLRENAPIKTIIHEHLHARSISRTPEAYGKYRRIEEATVELLAEEICLKNGVKFSASYKKPTNALRTISDLLGNDYYSFASELIMKDVADRQAWLEKAISEHKKKHLIKGLKNSSKFDDAMRVLFEVEENEKAD